jgi:hypothetical protein
MSTRRGQMDSLWLLEAAPSSHRSYPTGRRAPSDTLGVPWGCERTALGGCEEGIDASLGQTDRCDSMLSH